MTTVDRIFELLDELGMEQKEFAALIGTTDKTVSTWRTGRTHSYRKYLVQISEILGTTVQWLTTGEGPKKRQSTAGESGGLSENEKLFRSLPPDLQEEALRYMRYLAAQTGSAGESED